MEHPQSTGGNEAGQESRSEALSIWRAMGLSGRASCSRSLRCCHLDRSSLGYQAWYLDHPEAIRAVLHCRAASGARAVGISIGVVATLCGTLVRRLVGGSSSLNRRRLSGFILMPVVVNMARRRPSRISPGRCSCCWPFLAAARYVERAARVGPGSRRRGSLQRRGWLGMVLSTLPSLHPPCSRRWCLLPAARPGETNITHMRSARLRHCDAASTPSPILTSRSISCPIARCSKSNLGNSTAMYHPAIQTLESGLENTAYLIAAGTSPLLRRSASVGATWRLSDRVARPCVRDIRQCRDSADIRRRSSGSAAGDSRDGHCGAVAIYPRRSGKPAEFGRFLLFPDLALAVAAIVAIASALARLPASKGTTHEVLARLKSSAGGAWFCRRRFPAFLRQSPGSVIFALPARQPIDSRRARSDAERYVCALQLRQPPGEKRSRFSPIQLPYCLPPIDLFGYRNSC